MMFVIPFPTIDPVLIEIGPIVIRWYALAYLVGLIGGWQMIMKLADNSGGKVSRQDGDDFLVWATLGVVLGGRLGYVLFYRPGFYFENPAEILVVWQGGMSFHGGIAGVIVAAIWYARKREIDMLVFGDLIARVAPIGLFFGRLANFINGELYGRVSDVPWAMVFPTSGPEPRHPSQLYEAVLEGLVLFIILNLVGRSAWAKARPGVITGGFLVGYGGFRFLVEFVREPDAHLGVLLDLMTMGQILSVPMIIAGVGFILYAMRKAQPSS